jgi:hypothetical protein
MWEYEHTIETTATPDALWARWADVATWPEWNADIEQVESNGPFAVGTQITMTPRGADPVQLRIADVRPNELFIDEAELDGVIIRTMHLLEPLNSPTDSTSPTTPTPRTRITYRTQITGPAAPEIAPHLGPAITSDFPETMAALARAAGATEPQTPATPATPGA